VRDRNATGSTGPAAVGWPRIRKQIVTQSVSVGIATGAYGISFGAIAGAAGLDFWQAMALSLLMFTGGSQFALVGVVASGGNPFAGAATAVMLGSRNALYGLRMAPVLGVRGWRRAVAAQIVIDESVAVSIGAGQIAHAASGASSAQPVTSRAARLGFWATGIAVLIWWNLGSAAGALGADALRDPSVFGFDAAVAGAFLALLGPRLRERETWAVALTAALVAVVTAPVVPPGVPVLLAGVVAVVFAYLPGGATSK
jgi:predicted branched-subunit amino acid permease